MGKFERGAQEEIWDQDEKLNVVRICKSVRIIGRSLTKPHAGHLEGEHLSLFQFIKSPMSCHCKRGSTGVS